jgi:hypothetical protein
LLAEIGQSEGKIQTAAWNVMVFAKNLYIGFCLEQDSEIANQQDFATDPMDLGLKGRLTLGYAHGNLREEATNQPFLVLDPRGRGMPQSGYVLGKLA